MMCFVKRYILFSLFVVLYSNSSCQVFGGSSDEHAFSMISDGYILYLTGYTKSYGNGTRDGFIVKYNIIEGSFSYNTWGKADYDEYRSICKAGDDFIIAGFSFWRESLNSEVILTKINSQIESRWTNHHGNSNSQHAYIAKVLNSGEYLIGGVDRGDVLYDSYLVKTTCDGEKLWEYTYSDYMPSHIVDILELENENLLLLCSQGGFFNPSTIWHMSSHANADLLFVEVNSMGVVVRDKIISARYHDIPVKILPAPNDKFYILFHSQSYSENNSFDICLGLLNNDYEFDWVKTFGGSNFEYASDMEIDDEGNIYIVGTSASSGEEYPTIYYIKTDADGEVLEEQNVFTDYRGYAAGIEVIDTGIYILGTVTIDGEDNFVVLKNFELNKKSEFAPDLYIFPNPVTDYCKIVFSSMFFNNSTIQISIYNINGQIVYESEYSIVDSDYVFEIDLSGFRAGQYFIKTENSDFSETTKIIVIK